MSSPVLRFVLFLGVVVLAFIVICSQPPTLPIYRLAPPAVTASNVGPAGPFIPPGAVVTETADRLFFTSGTIRLEVYKSSGGFWLEDTSRLWNPDSIPQLLPDSSGLHQATAAMSTHGRRGSHAFVRDTSFTSFEFTGIRPTLSTVRKRGGATSTDKLDWRVGYAARVADRRPWARKFPVTGGGGEFKIHYGDQGRVIGAHGVWREIRGVAFRERLVPRADADREYLARVGRNHLVVFPPPTIAYYSAPAPFAQARLYPVYVYAGRMLAGGDTIALQVVTIPATRGPSHRALLDGPRPGSLDPEGPEEDGSGSPASTPWREVAASWLGGPDGAPSGPANVEGLFEELRADGWAVNFGWADEDAWYEDWNDDRARWADAADLLFYTGHAGLGGWDMYDRQNGTVEIPRFRRLSNLDSVHYGAQDLEWIVICACGPLQDDLLNPGADAGSALDRWSGVFDGLHLLLGFGSVTMDSPEMGRRFATYALEGKTIVNSWLRAAEEIQQSTNGYAAPDGPNVWAGAMWARKYGERSPYLDHLWGHGEVAKDPKNPDEWGIIWSPT
jgi:uncharacterized protein DUF6345